MNLYDYLLILIVYVKIEGLHPDWLSTSSFNDSRLQGLISIADEDVGIHWTEKRGRVPMYLRPYYINIHSPSCVQVSISRELKWTGTGTLLIDHASHTGLDKFISIVILCRSMCISWMCVSPTLMLIYWVILAIFANLRTRLKVCHFCGALQFLNWHLELIII